MENFLSKTLTQESPGKVMALLGATVLSLAFMFSVSYTNASFSGVEASLPDPFAMEKVVPAVDSFAATYSLMVKENFLEPLSQQYGLYADNAVWVFQESGLAYALGLEGLVGRSGETIGQVAGQIIFGDQK